MARQLVCTGVVHVEERRAALGRFAIYNQTRDTLVAANAECARSFWQRAKGLLGRKSIEPSSGLIISPCNSVHMWGMRFAIDVLYVSSDDRVLATVANLRPWAFGPLVRRSRWVLELPAGTIDVTGTSSGDQLVVRASAE